MTADKSAQIDAIIERQEEALKAAVLSSLKAMNKSATHANIKSYQAAKKALEDYQSKQAADVTGERFRNIEQASSWIIAQGYLVSPRTVRNHAEKMQGFPRKQKDGSYLKSEIEAYAVATWENPCRPTTETPPASNVDHGSRLKKALADEREIKVAQLSGSLISRAEVEQQFSARAAFLKQDLANFGPFAVDRFIELMSAHLKASGVDLEGFAISAIVPDLVAEYDLKLEKWLDRYTRPMELGND